MPDFASLTSSSVRDRAPDRQITTARSCRSPVGELTTALNVSCAFAELAPLLTEQNLVNQVIVTVSVVPLVAQINAITADAARKITAL